MTNEPKTITGPTGIWACKIGEAKVALPSGADAPMRAAVERAYRELTGEEAAFTFSGWSAELTEGERAVVENRPPQNPKTTAERDYPELPLAITSAPVRIFLDLGFNPREEDAHFSNLHELTWSVDNATGDGIEYVRADLAASPTAQAVPTHVQNHAKKEHVAIDVSKTSGKSNMAAPAAGAGPSGLTEETFCDLQFAERVLIAIAERQQQTGDAIEPVADIRHASRLARAARTRITRALSALSADFDAALAAAPQPPATAQEPVAWRYHCQGDPVKWYFSETPSLLGLYQPLYAHPAPQQAASVAELGALQAEIAGHEAANLHLSAMVDELRELLQDAKRAMTELHQAAIPDESAEGVPAIIPPEAFRKFVDARAMLCFCMHQRGHNPQKGAA